jgi:hypothetical protein
MNDNIAPEEKLLRLIRKGKKTDSKTAAKVLSAREKLLSPLKITLIAALGLSIIILAASVIYPFLGLKDIKLPQAKSKGLAEEETKEPQASEAAPSFNNSFQNNSMFNNIYYEDTPSSGIEANKDVNLDLIKDINLVGIISGDNPQAVIENKKVQKTYYLTAGQYLGEFRIDKIGEGKVTLDYKGQKFELYL